MKPRRMHFLTFALAFLACGAVRATQDAPPKPMDPAIAADIEADAQATLLYEGRGEFKRGHRPEAIGYYDRVIDHFSTAYPDPAGRIFCARSPAESLLYEMTALSMNASVGVLGPTWADAYLLKGIALVELGRLDEARASLQAAVSLSPQDSQYNSELGYTLGQQQDFDKALAAYEAAEAAVEFTFPETARPQELGRALRGEGFVLTELGKLDEAEAKYRKSQVVDPEDKRAAHELEYIASLRKKGASVSR
jgi:tetratricopeptide (TPR) repeat protein